jgi:hypothetical protein
MSKYRKTSLVEAVRFLPQPGQDLFADWRIAHDVKGNPFILIGRGDVARRGDWIVTEKYGSVSVMTNEEFSSSYVLSTMGENDPHTVYVMIEEKRGDTEISGITYDAELALTWLQTVVIGDRRLEIWKTDKREGSRQEIMDGPRSEDSNVYPKIERKKPDGTIIRKRWKTSDSDRA